MKRILSQGIFLLCVVAHTAMAEELTVTTYYPSRHGKYDDLRIANTLGIGTHVPVGRLTSTGTRSDPFAAACAAGLDWYDENGNTIKDNGECEVTSLAVLPNGNVGIGTPAPTSRLEIVAANTVVGTLGFGTPGQDLWFDGGSDGRVLITNTSTVAVADTIFMGYDPVLAANRSIVTIKSQTGNVGIGTETPAQRLHVNGLIRGQPECRVVSDAGPAPTYVSVAFCAADEWLMTGGGWCKNGGGQLGYLHSNLPVFPGVSLPGPNDPPTPLGVLPLPSGWFVDCWDPTHAPGGGPGQSDTPSEAFAVCCKKGG